jgi:hypothetical protein
VRALSNVEWVAVVGEIKTGKRRVLDYTTCYASADDRDARIPLFFA